MPPRNVTMLLSSLGLAIGLAACSESQSSHSPAPPPPVVGTVSVRPQAMAIMRDLPGRVAPTRVADVRARVGGLVIKRSFEQGSHVAEGAPLYQIDPAPYKAELASREADIALAEASLMLARQQSERFEALLDKQATSRAQYETAYATMKQAEAKLAGAKAAEARARLDLDYTTVRAPISGQIGRALLTEGALVDQNSPTAVLARIQQLDPIYVDITQSVGELRRLRRDLASGELARVAPDTATVRLIMEDGETYGHSGRLLFSDVTADPSTGQVTLRVEIPNPEGELFPGMYVRARIEQAIDQDAIVVPQQAVQRNADGAPEVFLVKADQTVESRVVDTGDVINGMWIVRDGLKPGDTVIVDGFQRISVGGKVVPHPADQLQRSMHDPASKPVEEPTKAAKAKG